MNVVGRQQHPLIASRDTSTTSSSLYASLLSSASRVCMYVCVFERLSGGVLVF
jgi:hypothetical protein